MSGRVEWRPKLAGETVLRYADFTDELAAGETVSGATCALTVWSGDDSSPPTVTTTVINNTAGIAAVAQCSVPAGVLGTIYQALVTATTSLSNVYQKAAYLAVVPNVP